MTTNSTIKSSEKIKLLDQMLEDLAGDEFDSYGETGADYNADLKRYASDTPLSEIDNIH